MWILLQGALRSTGGICRAVELPQSEGKAKLGRCRTGVERGGLRQSAKGLLGMATGRGENAEIGQCLSVAGIDAQCLAKQVDGPPRVATGMLNQSEMRQYFRIRRLELHGAIEGLGGFVMPALQMGDHAEVMPCPAILGPPGKNGAIDPLGLGPPARLLMLQGECHAGIIDHRERGYRQWRILG